MLTYPPDRDITSKYENARRMYTVEEVEEIRRNEYARGYKAGARNAHNEWYTAARDDVHIQDSR